MRWPWHRRNEFDSVIAARYVRREFEQARHLDFTLEPASSNRKPSRSTPPDTVVRLMAVMLGLPMSLVRDNFEAMRRFALKRETPFSRAFSRLWKKSDTRKALQFECRSVDRTRQ